MYNIEKKVPIPSHASNNNHKYPFSQMAEGDSFLINDVPDIGKAINSVKATASRLQVKIVYAQENGGLRVWLTDKSKIRLPGTE